MFVFVWDILFLIIVYTRLIIISFLKFYMDDYLSVNKMYFL